MINIWKRAMKKMDWLDVGLIKFTMIALTLFVITAWAGAMDWVHSVKPLYFFIATVIFGARPVYRAYIK